MDSVLLRVYSETASEIVVKVWTFDPDVTNRDSLHTFRQMLKEVPLKKGDNRIAIAFDEFYVPDFWFAQTGADRISPSATRSMSRVLKSRRAGKRSAASR